MTSPIPSSAHGAPPTALEERLVFAEVYEKHAAFVWRSMRRLGVRPGDVEDTCQDVFVVVHAKLDQFLGGSIRAWLFAIAARVASDYRKRAFVRHETADEVPEVASPETQTGTIERTQALTLLNAILDGLDDDKRAVFMLFELEQMPMQEVAVAAGCPLQTAYTRLHTTHRSRRDTSRMGRAAPAASPNQGPLPVRMEFGRSTERLALPRGPQPCGFSRQIA